MNLYRQIIPDKASPLMSRFKVCRDLIRDVKQCSLTVFKFNHNVTRDLEI